MNFLFIEISNNLCCHNYVSIIHHTVLKQIIWFIYNNDDQNLIYEGTVHTRKEL